MFGQPDAVESQGVCIPDLRQVFLIYAGFRALKRTLHQVECSKSHLGSPRQLGMVKINYNTWDLAEYRDIYFA